MFGVHLKILKKDKAEFLDISDLEDFPEAFLWQVLQSGAAEKPGVSGGP